ncbi:hypothetical protein CC85DRAFT_8808 [Cutaneotrichosporon oleaginosum]|uniref:Uncharacterized protein n=1 Tax=Cutaneotrichosporon oleaginosum TaxID=879819 RepID=A0A0J0XU09_9TREE|nr:uncharacterized protein CC85DRAFT_8808 [Cutaneotrichosporon oleaginosum]KLT44555.1 hypothetical protein CC85DRAFT_8808 [Cutaneotrichosporon oleaginosum]TXT13931.1 hypothetical protein COLE_00124 [Cutaneotrichosporon oleaginosum]
MYIRYGSRRIYRHTRRLPQHMTTPAAYSGSRGGTPRLPPQRGTSQAKQSARRRPSRGQRAPWRAQREFYPRRRPRPRPSSRRPRA